ncbi:hypothetical protein LINPERHAP1_LOCUS36 [Linum perenne]
MILRIRSQSQSRSLMIIYPGHIIRQSMSTSPSSPFQNHSRRLTLSTDRIPRTLESCTSDSRSGGSQIPPLIMPDGLLCSSTCSALTRGMRHSWHGSGRLATPSTFPLPMHLTSSDRVVFLFWSFLFISSFRISIQLFSLWIRDACPGFLFIFHLFLFCRQLGDSLCLGSTSFYFALVDYLCSEDPCLSPTPTISVQVFAVK